MEKVDLFFALPAVKFGISGPPIRPSKGKTANQEEFKCTEGGNDMVVFDYSESKVETKYITIEKDTLCCVGMEVYHATFRNFPVLRIENLKLEDCIFENCNTVYLTDCDASGCSFSGIDTLYADNTPLSNCAFTHLRCDNDCILCLEDSQISFCSFEDIELVNGAYLTNGVGDSWIETCRFEDVRTDREDRVIIFCEETVGRIIKRKKQFCIVDEESCTGLDQIKRISSSKAEPEDETAKLLRRAIDRDLISKSIAAMLKEDAVYDTSQWNARILAKPFADLISSIPVYNCLTRAGYKTIGDLVALNEIQILRVRHIGWATISRVKDMLHSQGIEGSAWDTFRRTI